MLQIKTKELIDKPTRDQKLAPESESRNLPPKKSFTAVLIIFLLIFLTHCGARNPYSQADQVEFLFKESKFKKF